MKIFCKNYEVPESRFQWVLNEKYGVCICKECGQLVRRTFYGKMPLGFNCGCGDITAEFNKPGSAASSALKKGEGVMVNGDVVSMYVAYRQYFVPKTLFQQQRYTVLTAPSVERLSVNIKTGAAYLYRKFVRERAFKRVDWTQKYMGIAHTVSEDTIKVFLDTVIEKMGLKGVHIEVPTDRQELLRFVVDLVCSPNMVLSYDEYRDTVSTRQPTVGDFYSMWSPLLPLAEFKKAQPRHLMDEGKYIDLMVKTFDLPKSRAEKKKYRANPGIMGDYAFIKSLGIKELDNVKKMEQLGYLSYIRYQKRFIKALVKDNGETAAVSKLFHFSACLADTSLMYDQIRRAKMKVSLSGSLKEIHDRFSKLVNILNHENKVIEYSKTELEREGTCGSFEFRVAKDTDKLVDIGTNMHICVGGYRELALHKQSTIYYMVDDTNRYQACIELQKGKLVQVKGYCNALLQGEPANAVKAWVTQKKISSKGCYDYLHMTVAA